MTEEVFVRKTIVILIGVNILFALGCSNQSSQSSTGANSSQASLNDYFIKLANWSDVAPSDKDDLKKVENKSDIKNEITSSSKGTCSIESFDLTKTPEKIVMQNPAAGVLYPGALVQGIGYLQGPGSLRELPIRKRAPMVVVSSLATEKNAVKMDRVNYETYQKAWSLLLAEAVKNKTPKPAMISFNQIEASSATQAALDLGFSAKYIGNSLSGDVKSKTNSKENTFMAVFEQNAYTMSVEAPETPAEFFSKDFSEQDLKTQVSLGNIGSKNLPLYVSSITYGRLLMFTVTSTASKEEIQAALNGAYNNGITQVDAKLSASYKKTMSQSTIKLISFGGDENRVVSIIKNGNLNEYFSESASLESFTPVSYVLRNLKDNSIAKVSETTKYSTEECTAAPVKSWKVKITIDKILMHYTGAHSTGEIYGKLFLNDSQIWSRTRSEYESTNNESNLKSMTSNKSIIVDLSLENKKPISLTARFLDNDDYFSDDILAVFNEKIGYTADGNDILQSGSYQTDSHRNVEIFYTVERLEARY